MLGCPFETFTSSKSHFTSWTRSKFSVFPFPKIRSSWFCFELVALNYSYAGRLRVVSSVTYVSFVCTTYHLLSSVRRGQFAVPTPALSCFACRRHPAKLSFLANRLLSVIKVSVFPLLQLCHLDLRRLIGTPSAQGL